MARLRQIILRECILYVRQVLLEMQPKVPRWVILLRHMGPNFLWFIFLICTLLLSVIYLYTASDWVFAFICYVIIYTGLVLYEIKQALCLPSLDTLVARSDELLLCPKFKDLQKLRQYMHEWLLLCRSSSELILREAEQETPDKTRLRQLYRYK